MDLTASIAAGCYAKARSATEASPLSAPIKEAAQDFLSVLNNTDTVARGVMEGTMDPHSLVQALSQTELAVEAAVVLRDKVVEAYQEIMRMPV